MKKHALITTAPVISLIALGLMACTRTPQSAPSAAPQHAVSSAPGSAASSQAKIYEQAKELPLQGEPLIFSADGADASVMKNTLIASIDPRSLGTCGRTKPAGYYNATADAFSGTQQTVYTFFYNKSAIDDGLYVISLLPNTPHYKTLEAFTADFANCPDGAMVPKLLNDTWLVLASSCQTTADLGNGVRGCKEIQKVVEPTLRLL